MKGRKIGDKEESHWTEDFIYAVIMIGGGTLLFWLLNK